MWIPTQYVILLVTILLLESAALFAYTLIGLIKQNPLPWLIPPQQDYSTCQYSRQGNSPIVRGGLQPQGMSVGMTELDPAQGVVAIVTSTSVVSVTSLISQTSAPTQVGTSATVAAPQSQGSAVNSNILGIIGTAASAGQSTVTAGPSSIASSASSSIAISQTSTTTSTPASNTDSSKTEGSTTAGPSVSGSSADGKPKESSASSGSSVQTRNIVTGVTTSTTVVPASIPPRSTSTTVVVVPPPAHS